MIHTLAVALRRDDLRAEKNLRHLKVLLKEVWAGVVLWTPAAQQELDFWLGLKLEELEAPMSFDAVDHDVETWLSAPEGPVKMGSNVGVLAADTSNTATGGGEFVQVNGRFEILRTMVAPLSETGIEESSTYRELEGLCKVLFTAGGGPRSKIVLLCDNQASVHITKKGSRVPKLQFFANLIFQWSLDNHCVVAPVWRRRNTSIIEVCDAAGRYVDHADYTIPARLFWELTSKAVSVFGKGIQVDRFAAVHNVQPVDCATRLPFNTRWYAPFSSGIDAFDQIWSGFVNFVNAPFCMLSRVVSLLKRQRAAAVIIAPLGSRQHWSGLFRADSPGVCARIVYNPNTPCWRMVGRGGNKAPRYGGEYAAVYMDFRDQRSNNWKDIPSAEELAKRPQPPGGQLCLTAIRSPDQVIDAVVVK